MEERKNNNTDTFFKISSIVFHRRMTAKQDWINYPFKVSCM